MMLINTATAHSAQLRIVLGSCFIVFFLALATREAHRSPWRKSLRSVRLMRALMLAILVVTASRMPAPPGAGSRGEQSTTQDVDEGRGRFSTA